MAANASFEVLADKSIRIELEITGERLGIITVAAAGIVSVLYIFREPIRNAFRNPNFPHDEPFIEGIQNGSLIVKLLFLTPSSFLRFYDDYKSGKLQDSLAEEIAKLTTKPTTETATTMTVFDESLPVKFKESLKEKFKNLRFDEKLTVKIRDEEKVKNHAEKLRANTVESQGKVPCITIVHRGAHARLIDGGDQTHGAEVKQGIIQAAELYYEALKLILQPVEDSTIEFVLETAKLLLKNGRVQDFPYMADRSADLLHGNKILNQILSEITSKCDEKTAYEEMQKYMYCLVLEELLRKSSVDDSSVLTFAVVLQRLLPATMQEYLVPYSEAIKHELQREKIANELKTKLDEYTRCETDGEAYLRSSDNKKAIQCCEKALAICTELGYQLAIGKECQNLATVYISMEQYEKAIVYLNEYLTASVKVGSQSIIAGANRNLGVVYFKLKRYEEGIAYLEKSLDMFTKLRDSEEIARTSRSLGEVYLSTEQYEEASRPFKDSLAMYTEIEDQSGIADTNWSLGRLFLATNQREKAMERFNKSIAIRTEIGNQYAEIARGNAYLGRVYLSQEEYETAITHLEIALGISESVKDKSGQATYCGDLGHAYVELARCEKAIFYYEKALKISTEIGDQAKMASSNSNLGTAYFASKKFDMAIEYFEKALAIKTGLENQNLATIIGNMGDAYFRIGQLEKAIECCKRGLAMRTEIGDQYGIAYNNARLGTIYVSLIKFEEAIAYYEKAIEISSLIRDRKIESACYIGLGKCYYFIYLVQSRPGLEPLKRSISYFRKSIECYDSIFLNLIVDENQTSFTNQYDLCYFFQMCCFISSERFETALLVADLGRAKTLQISIEKRSNVADYARKTWQAIDDEKEKYHISDIAKAIQLEENCATVLYYSFDLVGILNVWVLNCDQGNVNIRIPTYTLSRKDYIHTSVSKLLKTFNLTIDGRSSFFRTTCDAPEDDFKKLLLQESNPNNRVFQSETSACSEVKKQDLEKVAQGDDLVVEIEKKMSASRITENLNVDKANMNKGGTDNSEHLRNIFMALIHPIQEFIIGTKLIIIPDEFLFFVPFSALLDENGVYLSEKYSIQITPSLHTLYSRMLVSEPVSLGPALFVGNPTVGDVRFEGKICKFSSLPCATEEVTLLASCFHARPLTESKAIKSRVLGRISESSIIHIAAHGNNLRGEIFLAPNPEWIKKTNPESIKKLPTEEFYLLQEGDIISVNIRARLVVLSCCTTGRGKISSEGVIGLARSFLAAGAQSVLVTLWKISDEGTKLFMEKFYDELLKEVSVCEALKTTMNVFQRHETGFCRSFSIWAPFTIFGKDVRFSRDDIEEIKWQSHEISL